jgi:hypothetical protein
MFRLQYVGGDVAKLNAEETAAKQKTLIATKTIPVNKRFHHNTQT